MKVRKGAKSDKIELQMTAMIDVVFQLLVFFIMTFNVVEAEGDFAIQLPGAPAQETLDDVAPVKLKLKMTANGDGSLKTLTLNGTTIDSFAALHGRILDMLDGGSSSDEQAEYEVEIQCDFDLHYDNVIRAITAVSGERKMIAGKDEIITLIDKIRFAHPTNAPAK